MKQKINDVAPGLRCAQPQETFMHVQEINGTQHQS